MGNLGGYETIVKAVKALGGPRAAVTIVGGGLVAGGALLYAGTEAFVKNVVPMAKKRIHPTLTSGLLFDVTTDGEADNGLTLHRGEQFRVIESDGDAVIIEILGRDDNPHVAPVVFLESVSGYPSDALPSTSTDGNK